MDPQACFRRYQRATRDWDKQERQDACRDLCLWLDRGGFEPDWSPRARKEFFAYSVLPFRAE